MKSQLHQWLIFVSGFIFACAILGIWRYAERDTNNENSCDQKIDLILGHAALDDVPMLVKTLQLLDSNRVSDAKIKLLNFTWLDLEGAWVISKKYDGALDEHMNPLLTNDYQKLRQEINFKSFTNFPKDYLIEMTNFMKSSDAMTKLTNN
jgi:hypothetical protein